MRVDIWLLAYFGGWLFFLMLGAISTRLIWRRTAKYTGVSARVLVRTFWIAIVFTPGVAVCGAIAVVPFLVLVVAEIILPAGPPCGPFTQPNLLLVGAVWLVGLVVYGATHFFKTYVRSK